MIDPSLIDDLASRYESQAEQVAGLGRRTTQRIDTADWACARANRCRSTAHDVERDSRVMSERMRQLARSLRQLAHRRRAEIEAARQLEARVRQAIATHAGPQSPWAGTGWSPATLPPSGDPAWQTVARDLGIR
jgi:hypothetical protein